MTFTAFLLLLVLAGLTVLFKSGFSSSALLVFTAVALLALIPLYFGTRDRTKKASATETILATAWVWFRRLVCFTVGGLCILGVAIALLSPETDKSTLKTWLASLGVFLFGFAIILLGIYGQGVNRYDWKDDVRLHRENKVRYKWWL